ncbi:MULTISPECIES: DUF397 domain-containing protein [Catenuloplanes]|uniref:DUF397 domain-containing protein n=1 Tax=Catenuloplanes niger TaxID=587534 RepID=A0AAE3ZSR7_9ACTN|nr:DUF397 domain-containing protein [Catenuloplanes niger]MDR7324991.1 hypothetical protein [Catenuloplanes niger]
MKSAAQWRKSTYCDTASCVEVADLSRGVIGLRDGKNPSGPVLRFSAAEWHAFLDMLKLENMV